ncbi:cytochrome c oxidase subunit 6C [Anabrus simplex]|uniref:cytochrome c oxidase subunit 6C n=1 Tax=Anabrus simplex TaxID=316456 RepID=UPI0035A34253
MADTVQKIPKPQLRGLLNSQIKMNLPIAIGLAAVSGILFKVLVGDARKKRYAEFYRNYDAEAEFHRMRNRGLFQGAEPDPDS